jgi:glutamine transport system substrate-binding protein
MKKVDIRFMVLCFLIVLFSPGIGYAETLVVGCDHSFKPFVFKDKQGKLTGFDIDLWAAIAKDLNVTYELKPMDFDALIPALIEKKIDLALAGMTINSGRERLIDFSFPYFESGTRLMVRADDTRIGDIGDLVDKVVASKHGTISSGFAANIQTKKVVQYLTIGEAFAALQEKAVDAIIFDAPNLLYFANNEGKGKVKIVGRVHQKQAYGIAFQPGSPLREKVSITLLKFIEEGDYYIIFRKWFGYVPQ